MKLLLIRKKYDLDYTLGELFVENVHFAYTCEDASTTHKIFGESCIKPGEYKVTVTYSNRFKKDLPLLLDVPEYEGIRIHSGNTSKDTLGCILVGKEINWTTGRIWNCSEPVQELTKLIRNNPTTLRID